MGLTNMLNAMDRQIFPILLPPIQAHYGFPIEAAGLLATIFTLGIGLAALPAGIFADRFNRKIVIVVATAIFSLATGLQAFAFSFADMFVYRVMTGIGEGIQNAVLFAVAGVFLASRRTMALGVLTGGYGLGAALSPVIGVSLMSVTGHWQTPLIVLALFGVAIMLLWSFVPKSVTARVSPPVPAPAAGEDRTIPNRTGAVRWNIVALCVIAVFTGMMIYGYLGLYPTYLITVRGFTPQDTALTMSLFGIGGVFAIPLGLLADRWNQKALNLLALLGFAVIGASIFLIPSNAMIFQLAFSLLMGMMFTGIVYPNTLSLLQKNMPAQRGGFGTGLFVALLYVPASISGYILATLVTSFGWPTAGASMMCVLAAISLIAMSFYRPSAQLLK